MQPINKITVETRYHFKNGAIPKSQTNRNIIKQNNMKKITIFLLSCTTSLAGIAQAIPNAGFETWVNNTELTQAYMVPQGWMSGDMVNQLFNSAYTGISVSKSTQSFSGSFAVKMETAINSGDTVGGSIMSFQSMNDFAGIFNGGNLGFPYSIRSTSLKGYYKFNSIGNDGALISVSMTKWNTTTNTRDVLVEENFDITANAAAYTLFDLPITYLDNESPDTVFIDAGIYGPNNNKSHVGTTFYLDALSFTGTAPTGLDELYSDNRYVKLYPNPFNNSAIINIDIAVKLNNASISIFDILGKEVKTINNINKNEVILEKGEMSAGLYFYKLLNNSSEVSNGKFIIR